MKRKMHKGNFTIEASIYVPLILFVVIEVLSMGIVFFQESCHRELEKEIIELDILKEFYNYQIFEEIGSEVLND